MFNDDSRRNYNELKTSECWSDVPQSLYKEILDKILPVSLIDQAFIKISSKVTVATSTAGAQLNATINNPPLVPSAAVHLS